MNNEFSVAAHWSGDYDEAGLQRWAENLRRQLRAPHVGLGLVFMSPKFFAQGKQILEILRVHAQVPLLANTSTTIQPIQASFDPFTFERRPTPEIDLADGLKCGAQQPIRVVGTRAVWDPRGFPDRRC